MNRIGQVGQLVEEGQLPDLLVGSLSFLELVATPSLEQQQPCRAHDRYHAEQTSLHEEATVPGREQRIEIAARGDHQRLVDRGLGEAERAQCDQAPGTSCVRGTAVNVERIAALAVLHEKGSRTGQVLAVRFRLDR
jgi:hypothetical protein